MGDRTGFTPATMHEALDRQGNACAVCGTYISALGISGASLHEFGEGVNAHHLRPASAGGSGHVSNCVIICQSCHYSVHQGGNYRAHMTQYESDYPYFRNNENG